MKIRARGDGEATAFAAQPYNLFNPNDYAKVREVMTVGAPKAADAWKWYEEIGEVGHAVDMAGRLAAYGQIEARKLKGAKRGETDESGPTLEALGSLWSPYGGQGFLISRFTQLMKVTGDAHLIANIVNGEHHGYDFVSTDELHIDKDDRGDPIVYRRTMPLESASGWTERDESQGERLDPKSYVGRVWIPHPRYTGMARGGLMPVLRICEDLFLLTLSVRAKLYQRLVQAGILFIPSEVSMVSGPSGASAMPGGDANELYGNDPIIHSLVKDMMTNRMNLETASAFMPSILRGPAAIADAIRLITVDRTVDEIDMQLRAEALDRILSALDAQKSSIKGSEDSNHWNSWGDQDNEIRLNIGPEMDMFSWAIQSLLGDQLFGEAKNKRIQLGVDLSRAATRPNLAEDARQSADTFGAVSPTGVRELAGIGEEYAPTDDELVRMVGWKLANPWMSLYGLPVAKTIDWDEVERFAGKKPMGQDPGSQAEAPSAGPESAKPSKPTPESDRPKSKTPR